MSAELPAWLRSIGIIAERPPKVRSVFNYEEGIRLWGNVSLFQCSLSALSYISPNCNLINVSIGRYCSIGHECSIGLSIHPTDRLTTSSMTYQNIFDIHGDYHIQDFKPQTKPIVIGHDVWIGAGATILPGLNIGMGAVIGAGSVVTKDVDPYAVVAGNPAVKKRSRFDDVIVSALCAAEWWQYDLREAMQKGIIDDWGDPILVIEKLRRNFECGNIQRLSPRRRILWQEGSQYKSKSIDPA